MFKEKLEEINSKFKEVEQKLSDSNIIAEKITTLIKTEIQAILVAKAPVVLPNFTLL